MPECRFRWDIADRESRETWGVPADRDVLSENGKPILTFHRCPTCGHLHWIVPAAEAEGTAADLQAVREQGLDAAIAAGLAPENYVRKTSFHVPRGAE